MSDILVTGASGFLGTGVVEHLTRSGFGVRAGIRPTGETDSGAHWKLQMKGVDAIVHCAGRAHVLAETAADPLAAFRTANTTSTLDLAASAALAGVRRFIFISSIGVNGSATNGRPFRHDDPPNPHSPYAVSKLEAETGLAAIAAATGLEVVVVRPPLIMGPDPKGNLGRLNRAIAVGLPLPFGSVRGNRRDLISRDTLCRLIDVLINHPAAAGQTFLASDGEPISTRTLLEKLALQQGRRARLFPFPPAWIDLGLLLLGRRALASQLLGNLEVDITHTRETLGWAP